MRPATDKNIPKLAALAGLDVIQENPHSLAHSLFVQAISEPVGDQAKVVTSGLPDSETIFSTRPVSTSTT